MLSRLFKNRAVGGLLIASAIIGLSILGISLNGFNSLHEHFADSLYTIDNPSSEIVIIGIDDKSTQPSPVGLGRFSQWTRDKFTDLLEVLKDENAKLITFDLIFHTPTEEIPREKILILEDEVLNAEDNKQKLEIYNSFVDEYKSIINNPVDNEFAEKLKEFENIILAGSFNSGTGKITKPLTKFLENSEIGIVNTVTSEKGVLRKSIPYFYSESEDKYYDDIALVTVKKYLGEETIDIPTENGEMMINFFGNTYSYEMISFVDVVNRDYEKDYFKNKIVLIGITSAKEVSDEYITPKSKTNMMPGVEFRANEIQTILDGKFLVNQSKIGQIATVAGIAVALTIAMNYLGIILSIVLTIVALFLYLGAAHLFYKNGVILNMVYPFAAIVLAYVGSWVYKYFVADKGKREMKSAFSHYVSDKLVEEISKNPDMVKLGGEKRLVTVFFTDIKDSTKISEKTEITAWVSQLNEYFTTMEDVIQKCGGTIDKFEGDAIMGFFNAPLNEENHVVLSFIAALEMKKALLVLNDKWGKEGKQVIEFRIGINTGESIVGNVGSKNRFDYTAMGDTVNTASRLESAANKTYGTSIIAAGFEQFAKPEMLGKIAMRELDLVLLPGKTEPVKIYEILGLSEKITAEIQTLITNYTNGLASYRNKDWQKAIEYFQSLPNDNASKVMLERCRKLMNGEMVEGLDENMVYRIFHK